MVVHWTASRSDGNVLYDESGVYPAVHGVDGALQRSYGWVWKDTSTASPNAMAIKLFAEKKLDAV